MDLEFYPSRFLLMGFLLGATQVCAMEENRMVKRVSGTDLDLSGTGDFLKNDKSIAHYVGKVKPGKPLVLWKVGLTGNPAAYFSSGSEKDKEAALNKLLAQSENPISRLSCYTLATADGEFTRDDRATAQMSLRVAQAYLKQIQSTPEQRPEIADAVLALVDRLNADDQVLGRTVAPEFAQLQNEMAAIEQPAIAGRAEALLGAAIRSAQLNPNDTALAQYKLALLRAKNGDNDGAITLFAEVLRSGNLRPDVVPNAIQHQTLAKYRSALALANRLYGDPSEAERIARETKERTLLEDILQPGIQLEPEQLATAQYHLAHLCLNGENKDANRARDLLTVALGSGNLNQDNLVDAQLQLAILCANSENGQQHARELFEGIIANGNTNATQLALAHYKLAHMCFVGQGGAKNDERARELLGAVVRSSQLPHEEQADAEYKLAMLCLDARGGAADPARARVLFKSALDSKLLNPTLKAVAQYRLADLYVGAPANNETDAQARRLFREALDSRVLPAHSDEAKYKLAELFRTGRGGAADMAEARKMYEAALADGNGLSGIDRVNAQYRLALILAENNGNALDRERAVTLFEAAIDSNLLTVEARATAQNTISQLVDPNQRAEVAELLAWRNLEDAIRSAHTPALIRANAQYDLALRYNRGTPGGMTNKPGAAEMFEAAIRSGLLKPGTQANAEFELALLYGLGIGIEQNLERAIELLKHALSGNLLYPDQKTAASRWMKEWDKGCTIL